MRNMPCNKPNWILLKECGEKLATEGETPFSRRQLINCVHEIHPERGKSSLNPMIQGMTVNLKGGAPGGVGKNIFYSVGRGLFELYDPGKHGATSKSTAVSVAKEELTDRVGVSITDSVVVISAIEPDFDLERVDESFTENTVKMYFKSKGFHVCTNCEKSPPQSCCECPYLRDEFQGRQHGIDIVARRNAETWIVEVKGVRPSRGASYNQAFYESIAQTILNMKTIEPNTHYAIALPAAKRYLNLLKKLLISAAFRELNLHVLLLREDQDNLVVQRLDSTAL